MLFNSVEFAFFLPVVFILYWFLTKGNPRVQNGLLVVASYFFYGWWDWRFLFLIFFSSVVDFIVGLCLRRTTVNRRRKILLVISIIVNLGCLGFFKYFNFFAENFTKAFSLFGRPIDDPITLNIILPIGISFYTFQTLSYSIDVYRRKLTPTRDILAFFAFVSFFPQLVAGPIERATNLLPQFFKKRQFDYEQASDGMRLMLWGFFKKIVIADNCAIYANEIFANSSEASGSTLLLGVIFFAFQIYGDFSGYSDIAIGASRLFGFSLMRNFAFPYFSRDIAEFWRRWHISLSTWFRDYLYIPLGGSRGAIWLQVRNIFIIFIVSGFWHGANWTFLVWGALNAIYFLPLSLLKKNRTHTGTVAEGCIFPSLKEILLMGSTFSLTLLAWVFFRAESVTHAFEYCSGIFSLSLFSWPPLLGKEMLIVIGLVGVLLAMEWLQRQRQNVLKLDKDKFPKVFRWGLYYGVAMAIVLFGARQNEFIYFQF